MNISPSKLKVKLSSKKEMRKLYEKFGFEQKIAHCTRSEGVPYTHPFCCTTRAIRYFDPDLNDEIAMISEVIYDHPDGPEKSTKRTEITRLVIAGEIYQLKHP